MHQVQPTIQPTANPPQKRVFGGFNELRATAALVVMVNHVEMFKLWAGVPSAYTHPALRRCWEPLGQNGVIMFFTLSGFLITYLLCAERQANGFIHVRHFYTRRILRIWPLYYVALALAVLVLPVASHYFPGFFGQMAHFRLGIFTPTALSLRALALHVFIAPNVAVALPGGILAGATQLWSIGVEEQFYLLWPFLLMLPQRRFAMALLVLGVACATYGYWATPLFSWAGASRHVLRAVGAVLFFQYMCLGAGAALLIFFKNQAFLRLVRWRGLPWLLVPGLLAGIASGGPQLLLGLGFALAVAMLAERPGLLSVRWLAHLGTLSYGLYMYHVLVLYTVMCALQYSAVRNPIAYSLLAYGLTLAGTYAVARLSYRHLEQRFLNLKHRFE